MLKSMFRQSFVYCFFLLTLLGCSESPSPTPTPRLLPTLIPEELRGQIRADYVAASDPLLSEWRAVNLLAADNRGRDWLDQIGQLQSIRKSFAQLTVDPSLAELHNQMILHMDCQIASYMALVTPQDYAVFEMEVDPNLLFSRCQLPGAE